MIAALARFIDWSAIQVQTARMRAPKEQGLRLEESLQFLRGPDFISRESRPLQVEFDGSVDFRSPTPRPSAFAVNNVVHGRLYRCSREGWQRRPVIILLHGWNSVLSHRVRFPLIARSCNQAGLNAATLVAPYHFQRKPSQPGAAGGFDYLRLAERTAQAVAEIRALTGWLLREGCAAVALWGSSYGGWLAGLTVCHDPRLAAVVMAVPSVRINRSRAERVLWRRSREVLLSQRAALEMLDTTALNLISGRPAIPKENILLIEALHDLMTPREPIEELWQAWGKPEIWRLAHGHFSFSLVGAPLLMTQRVLGWLRPRLDQALAAEQSNALP